MGAILFDEEAWPLVVVRYPRVIEHEDFMRHLRRVVSFIQRREPWGMINDSRGSGHPNAEQRQAIAAMYDEHEALAREYWRATAIIFSSPVIVGVLAGLTWLRPLPHPVRAFAQYEEGKRWVVKMLSSSPARAAEQTAAPRV